MKQEIIVVSHCFLNDAAKLKNQKDSAKNQERELKRAFLKQMLSQGIEIIQLPCPEFILYGCNRWGHASSQFDTPHFRREARKMLEPVVDQLEEYDAYPDRYEILGIIGVDASPSCGVNYTYDGDWGGELGDGSSLSQTLPSLHRTEEPGIFMDVLKEMLHEKHLSIKLYSLDTFASISRGAAYQDASQVDLPIRHGENNRQNPSGHPSDDNGLSLW